MSMDLGSLSGAELTNAAVSIVTGQALSETQNLEAGQCLMLDLDRTLDNITWNGDRLYYGIYEDAKEKVIRTLKPDFILRENNGTITVQKKLPQSMQNIKILYSARMGIVEELLEALSDGADIHTTDDQGKSALFLSLEHSQMVCLTLLLVNGANPDQRDYDSRVPLLRAYEMGNMDAVGMLLDFRANIHASYYQHNLLNMAVSKGNIEHVKEFLRRGANINQCTHEALGPLRVAIDYRNVEMVRWLLAHGADATVKDGCGETLLWPAVKRCPDVIEDLIAAGVDVNQVDRFGKQTVMWDAVKFRSEKTIRVLVENGADLNIQDENGVTVLSYLIGDEGSKGLLKTKLLLDLGADPNLTRENGVGPLYWSVSRGEREITEILLAAGAVPTAKIRGFARREGLGDLIPSNPVVPALTRAFRALARG